MGLDAIQSLLRLHSSVDVYRLLRFSMFAAISRSESQVGVDVVLGAKAVTAFASETVLLGCLDLAQIQTEWLNVLENYLLVVFAVEALVLLHHHVQQGHLLHFGLGGVLSSFGSLDFGD